ncbi:hypothetical protein FOCC_FOCC007310 [Frankliniella occidentalis]|nr:hypothetical protein FOCC_FOCC007310 [Frankliniella occidentalis]
MDENIDFDADDPVVTLNDESGDEEQRTPRKGSRDNTPEKTKRRRGDSNKKTEHRDQTFRVEWLNNPLFKNWLESVKGKPKRAFCRCCQMELNAEITILKRHGGNKTHAKNSKAIGAGSGQKTILQCVGADTAAVKLQKSIKEAEIRKCAFLAANNIAIRAVEPMVATDKKCYPDSKIAQGMQLGRTKTTKVITNVIAKCHQNDLADTLKQTKFSVIIDESTDIGTIKSMAVCVRFHEGVKVITKFWKLVQVFSEKNPDEANEGATARRLFDLLMKSFTDEGVPLVNLIGFASDGCNTMFGSNNSVAQRLQETFPGITVLKCLCHSLHLVASEACKELPRKIEDLARNIYGMFKSSAKRQAAFAEFQAFYEAEPHKILRPAQTRWLSLQSVVNRILEQWEPLKGYFTFQATEKNLVAADNIVIDRALITVVYKKMCTSYKDLLLTFMDKTYVERTPLDLVNPADNGHHIPLQNIYLGVKVMRGFSELRARPDIAEMERQFRLRCKAFLVKSCCEMRARFDFSGHSPFARMACLNPKEVLSSSSTRLPSLLPLIETVPRICDPNDLDRVQVLDDQWRLLDKREFVEGMEDWEADEFWTAVRDHEDLDGKQSFKELGSFALEVLSLPHSNAACERCFSKINLVKTKIRNRLQTETLNGLLLASQCAKEGDGSQSFEVTPEMIASMNSDNLKPRKKVQPAAQRTVNELDAAFEVEDNEEDITEEDYAVVFEN